LKSNYSIKPFDNWSRNVGRMSPNLSLLGQASNVANAGSIACVLISNANLLSRGSRGGRIRLWLTGNESSGIAKQMPGRSTNALKNRWYSGLKSDHELNVRLELRPADSLPYRGFGSDFISLGRGLGLTPRGDDHDGDISNRISQES
jgi:hypothetical protein